MATNVLKFTEAGLQRPDNKVEVPWAGGGKAIINLDAIEIGCKVRQARSGKIGTVCKLEARNAFMIVMDDGSAHHHQSTTSISPFTKITLIEPLEMVGPTQINALLARHEQWVVEQRKNREEAERQKAIDKAQYIAELRLIYPDAQADDGKMSSHARAAKNIRMELKAAFPGVTFKVRSRTASMMDAVDVDWTNGPTSAQVNAILNKYQDSDFDGMTDSTICRNSAYGQAVEVVLSRAKYVRGQREISDEVREAVQRGLATLQHVEYKGPNTRVLDGPYGSVQDQAWQLFCDTTFPLTWQTLTVVSNDDGGSLIGGSGRHWAKVIFDAPVIEEPKAEAQPETSPVYVAEATSEAPAEAEPFQLPPDVAAYLIQATVEEALNQRFVPKDEDELRYWMLTNGRQIGQRAKNLMAALLDKFVAHQDAVIEATAFSLYVIIRSNQQDSQGE